MQASYFDRHYNDITNVLPFNPEWPNGTGYFDNAVYKVKLQPGELASSIDKVNRRIIFVGTRFGTCVFFERFSRPADAAKDSKVRVVSNVPARLRTMVTDTELSYSEFSRCTTSYLNIGKTIETLFDTENKYFRRCEKGLEA